MPSVTQTINYFRQFREINFKVAFGTMLTLIATNAIASLKVNFINLDSTTFFIEGNRDENV